MNPILTVKRFHITSIPPSPTLEINERSKKLISSGHDIIQLGFGQSPFPVPDRLITSLQKHAHRKEYAPVQGLAPLREAISDYYNRNLPYSSTADDILVGPGSKELIFIIQRVCQTGLLLPAPSWVSYAPQANLCGKPVAWIPTTQQSQWTLQPAQLEDICVANPQSRLLITNFPGNPTGTVLTDDQARKLAKVARKYNLVVISDEIYAPLQFEGTIASIARYYPEGTIITGGLSKWCGAGGWRLGTAVFPPELKDIKEAGISMASETFTSVCTPVQMAAISAYREDHSITNYIESCRLILKSIGQYVYQSLTEAGLSATEPAGGFYLFISFQGFQSELNSRGINKDQQLCKALLDETSVALLPGSAFGMPAKALTARLAFVDFDGEYALNWIRQHGDHINFHQDLPQICCHKLIRGIDRICQWVNEL